jgi:hypothetical protein
MRHFIIKMISTSSEKEEERESEIRPSRQETDHYKNINL